MDMREVIHKLIDRAQLHTEAEVLEAKDVVDRTFSEGTGTAPDAPTEDPPTAAADPAAETVTTGTLTPPATHDEDDHDV